MEWKDFEQEFNKEFDVIISWLTKEFDKVRSGRVNVNILNNVLVNAYGMSTPIMQLANAQLQDARTVILKPYDKSLVKEMSGSLQNANLGCNIQSEDVLIKLVFPMQTEENRKNNVKKVKEFLETAKLRIRQERQKVQTKIKANEVLTQDQKRNFETELDKTIKNANLKLENMFKTKEQELMKI